MPIFQRMYKCPICKFETDKESMFKKHNKSALHKTTVDEHFEKMKREKDYIKNLNEKYDHASVVAANEAFTPDKLTHIVPDKFIRNYGSERTDYISNDVLTQIIKHSKFLAISKYVQLKHFILDFPENHNIIYFKDQYHIKIDDEWLKIEKKELENRLYYDNKKELTVKIEDLKVQVKAKIVTGIELREINEFEKYIKDEYRVPIL